MPDGAVPQGEVLYVAHAIDTGGPLYESLDATFERLEFSLGLRLDPRRATLERIRRGEVDLRGREESSLTTAPGTRSTRCSTRCPSHVQEPFRTWSCVVDERTIRPEAIDAVGLASAVGRGAPHAAVSGHAIECGFTGIPAV